MYTPLRAGGFGFPVLAYRLGVRLLQSLLLCLNARSALVRGAFRVLLQGRDPVRCTEHDLPRVRAVMAEVGVQFSLPPYVGILPAPRHDAVRASYAGGPVAIVLDGSVAGERLSWAALVASPEGLLATTCGSLLADHPSSWAAE